MLNFTLTFSCGGLHAVRQAILFVDRSCLEIVIKFML